MYKMHNMFNRLLHLPDQPKKSCFLFGPRGTGKTWWLKHAFPEAIYLDLLDSDLYMELLASPKRLEQIISPGQDQWIIIDEVQKLPDLLNEVHRLIEMHRWAFILTGSSARSLRRKGVNLLAGRALTYHMYPLTCKELGSQFDFEKSLRYGHLPAVFSEPNPAKYLSSYIHTYLKEEVLQEGLTRNLSGFSRFLEVASLSQGQVVNMAEIAREIFVSRKVVESFFAIAEDLLLTSQLPVFTRRAKRRLITHSKFYFFDVGVFRALRPTGPLDISAEIEGAAYETLVFQELKAINDYLDLGYQLYFWRTSNQVEVDFVLYGERGLLAFEVKHSNKISSKDLHGLKAFAQDYPEAQRFILYGGHRREYIDGIHVIPVVEALQNLESLLTEREF